jgi:CubicO group peptidase (beta-lactamase class C family)
MRLVEGDPKDAGFSPERLTLIRDRAEEWVTEGDIHRTLVLLAARNGVIGFHEAFGVDGPEPDAAPLTVDAIFPFMSQTKSITATMIMMLVEDGLVGLSRPIQDYLPEFEGERKDKILIHHLLTHTSGIETFDFWLSTARVVPQLLASTANAPESQHPITHLFLELAYGWPAPHPAGEAMRYSDINYLLLGEVVRRVSDRSLDEFASERLFEPLHMTDSSFGVPADRADRVVRRSFEENPGERAVHSEERRGMMAGAGGAYGTALDLATFTHLFLERGMCGEHQLLHPTSVARMTSDQIPGLPAYFFDQRLRAGSMGYGWLAAQTYPMFGWPTLPLGSWTHGGAGLVMPWADPSTGVVGVFCSVADRYRSTTHPDDVKHHADLFSNLVTSATVD